MQAYLTEYTNTNHFYEQHRSSAKWKLCIKKKPLYKLLEEITPKKQLRIKKRH